MRSEAKDGLNTRASRFATAVAGGVTAGLATAMLTPSAVIAGFATVAGLIGSGLWIARHG